MNVYVKLAFLKSLENQLCTNEINAFFTLFEQTIFRIKNFTDDKFKLVALN